MKLKGELFNSWRERIAMGLGVFVGIGVSGTTPYFEIIRQNPILVAALSAIVLVGILWLYDKLLDLMQYIPWLGD